MVKSRQRRQNSELMIKTKRKWYIELGMNLLSILIWIYVGYAFLFFITAFLNISLDFVNLLKIMLRLRNQEIIHFIYNILIYSASIGFLLYAWGMYNKLRYGRLNRRQYPQPTSPEEILKLNMIDMTTYKKLQQMKMITFYKNPIKDEFSNEE